MGSAVRLSEVVTAVRELDAELTSQKIEVTLHGAAIKQLLEERKLERDHAWQVKLLAFSVFLTEAVQLYAILSPHISAIGGGHG